MKRLLALPHAIVLALLWIAVAGLWVVALVAIVATGRYPRAIFDFNLLPVLVLIAGGVLLFTGRYPRDIFNLVVGINRGALRVAAYALLMRDEYPPFRLGR